VVAGLLAGGLTDDGKTFKEFLAGCAAGTVAACVPTPAQRCGLEMQAVAFGLAPGGYSLDKETLWNDFGNLLLEVTGGPQLGAFFKDTESRRDWLQNANYGSTAITSAAAAQLNDKLMREYVTKVLDPNIEALRTYLKPSSFTFLSRVPDSADSIDQRDRLLIAMVGSWTATADSLSLAAQRWNEIYRLDGERRIKANQVAGYLGEMYRAAAVIIQLHKEAGKAAEAAPIAAGLNTLLLRYAALTNTFNELLFARDGELAVSSSLDPEQASRGVLAQRHEAALEAVDDASTKVDTLLQTLLDNDIRNADLFANLDNAVNESQKRLVELCGQPVGCDVLKPEDAANKDCDTSWKSGVCGFDQDRSIAPELRSPKDIQSIPAQENASEATLAIYDFGAAGRRVTQAQTHQDNLKRFRDTSVSTTAAFVAAADRAFQDRTKQIQKTYDDFNNNYNSVRSNEDLEIAAISTSIAVDASKLVYLGATTAGKIATATAKSVAITTDAGTTLVTERVAKIFKSVGEKVTKTAKESSQCVDLTLGLANRTGAPVCAVAVTGYVAGSAVEKMEDIPAAVGQIKHTVSVGIQAASDATMVSLDALRELFDASNDFAQSIIDKAHAIRAAREGSNLLKIENDERFAEATYENVTKYAEDLDTWRQMALEDTRLLYEYVDATATTVDTMADVIRAKGSYLQIVESARQERATLEMRRLQRNQIAQLVAGPQAVFFAANGLAEAERELDRAKRKMNDWLVALEYAAVRPFYNERMSILLARNTYQLRAIADRLTDLEGQCGGATNLQDGTVSLRNDLLGLRTSQVDSSFTPPRTLTPAERFQQTLAQSDIPAAATMRYTVSQTADQVASDLALLVVNFNLGLSQFANLRATCNAKVAGIALKLVGDNLGNGQPYATLLYNGNSQTYSCQPGIDAYVQTFGQGDATFGSTTSFVVDGRAASPVAGVGEMGSSNVTFAGLPLAGNYTLIIDPTVPANAAINWANLEDIEMGLSYTYQDVFSSTSDCANSL
jgi:HJR/Mrr/RecB family endonuclease